MLLFYLTWLVVGFFKFVFYMLGQIIGAAVSIVREIVRLAER